MRPYLLALALLALPVAAPADSEWVRVGPDGRLAYKADAQGNCIADFSNVGYHQGLKPIPVLSVGAFVEPTSGDATSRIQAAIDKVAKMYPNASGYRGAVFIPKGTYKISGTLFIRAGGIVLRGEGDGADGTILVATGAKQRSLIVVGPREPAQSKGKATAPRPDIPILDPLVPIGAHRFSVPAEWIGARGLKVGLRIELIRPSTEAWIHTIGMDAIPQHGADRKTVEWTAGSKDIVATRIITAIDDNRVTIDAPVMCTLDSRFGGGLVRIPDSDPALAEVGIENLRGDSEYKKDDDEEHGWIFVEFAGARDSWVRQVTTVHYGYGLVKVDRASRQVTVEHCACLDPISQITGGRRYSYCLEGELNLVQHSYSRQARHDFVMLSTVSGPNVFFDCVAEQSHADSGAHERWSVGTLYDNVRVSGAGKGGGEINLQDRGNMGTGHGWSGADQVLWNCKADRMIIQNPPTAQNWAIGCVTPNGSGDGIWDSRGQPVFPRSLYLAQLSERVAAAATPANPPPTP